MPATQTRKRILVVDDEKRWRNILREILEEEKKYAVDTAEDHREATAKLARADAEGRPFSLVTVDLAFEGSRVCDGELLLRHIALTYKGTSCIVVSGSESSPDRASELTSKYDARFFQKKGFLSGKSVKFLEVVETVLESREGIGVSSKGSAATMDSDEIANLQTQLKIRQDNLNRLEELRASKGLDASKDLELMNKIEYERQEIAGLKTRLQELKGSGN